jgi:lipoprotein signal peptidase
MTARAIGGGVALVVLAIDQAAKALILGRFAGTAEAPLAIAPILDLTLRWNRGISFSLFTQDSASGRAVLLGLTAIAILLLSVWLMRSQSRLAAIGLGAIIGGALGNGLDRLARGAVVDFLDLHMLGRHFFVFNVADAAINLGVALLILDALIMSRASVPSASR